MGSNYDSLIRLFEQDPVKCLEVFYNSIDDGTLRNEDTEMFLKKLERIQPEVDYNKLCRMLPPMLNRKLRLDQSELNLDPSNLKDKILCHFIAVFLNKEDK
jgi:hypothetical protein